MTNYHSKPFTFLRLALYTLCSLNLYYQFITNSIFTWALYLLAMGFVAYDMYDMIKNRK
ncbi:hypothetical protein [Enterococcus sp. AZ062]|uniref:hypothetical protein n=1 Tax=Enterococcus sp. AZ062 TaxID=2774692 RepID=UPI003F68C911